MGIKHIGFAYKLIETAETDYEASKLLYQNEMYAQAVFHLQSSVEKLVKSYSIIFHDFTPKNIISEIVHTTPQAFITPLVDWWSKLYRLSQLIEKTDENHNLVVHIKKTIDSYPGLDDLANLRAEGTKKEVKKLLDEYGKGIAITGAINIKLALSKNRQSRELVHEWLDDEDRLETDVELFLATERMVLPEDIPEEDKNRIMEHWRDYRRRQLNLANIFTLAVLTFPHAIPTRYPDENYHKFLSPHNYNKELGIVQCFKQLSWLLRESIKWFREDLEIISSFVRKEIFGF